MSILSLVIANDKHILIYFKTFLFRGEFFTRKWDFTWRVSDCDDYRVLSEDDSYPKLSQRNRGMILHLFFFSATGHLGNLKGEINVYCIQHMSYIKIFMTEILPGLSFNLM